MGDADCVAFLQWALPRLGLRWQGFRKVHGQVCKRVRRRMKVLGVESFAAYLKRLDTDPEEWTALDGLAHITISRFFRDKSIFETLERCVLPEIATRARRDKRQAQFWSAGCASGEEPYTLNVLWDLGVANAFPGVACSVVATDVDDAMLTRARKGCYSRSSLRELPETLILRGFDREGSHYCVGEPYREGVRFLLQDLRSETPEGPFDLILCRNVAFTYFEVPLQRNVLDRLVERLTVPGYLVIGAQEKLPQDMACLVPFPGVPEIFRYGKALPEA